jgi:hypothetical protein
MATPTQRGARARVHSRAPSVDLVRLVELLTKIVKADTDEPNHPVSWPLFGYDAALQRLRINTRGALSRLYQNDAFKDEFRNGENLGFLRDVLLPNRGSDAKMGGRILVERIPEFARAVTELQNAIGDELNALMASQGLTATAFVVPDSLDYLTQLAGAVGTHLRDGATESSVVPIQFTEPDRSSADRQDDVARLIAAVEEVESRDWLENMEKPARRILNRRGLDDDEIEGSLANLRREAARLDSQAQRFLNFLDDEALARVRSAVTFSIMGAIKDGASKRNDLDARLLVRYVENIEKLSSTFCDSDEVLKVDLSRVYGVNGTVSISDQLRKAMYFNCLPVWAEWVNQMFEFRPMGGGSLAREVSYRFRINGDNPAEGASALLSRLNWYEEDLISDAVPGPTVPVGRDLAELFLLAVATPTVDDLDTPCDVAKRARELAWRLEAGGKHTLQEVIAELRAQDATMDRIARALVFTLRSRGKALVVAAEKKVREQYICVQESVVDWERLAAATGTSQDFFKRPKEAGQSETPLWFSSLVITDNPTTVPGLLFSVRVHTRLRERALTAMGNARTMQLQRDIEGSVLPVAWRPFNAKGDGTWQWNAVGGDLPWLTGPGIDVEYEPKAIGRAPVGAKKDIVLEDAQQRHSAAAAAFTVLTYLCLWLVRDMATADGSAPVRTLMLRFQNEGRRGGEEQRQGIPGDEVVYAASQAVEAALSCEAPTYMQGLVLANDSRFRDSGAFTALTSAYPLLLASDAPPVVKRIALISYTTRPVSEHPQFPAEEVFLYKAKTYVAESVDAPFAGYRLREDRTQSHIQPKEAFEEPALIFEEIGRLKEAGYEHIMLLWHHYGNWRIGRTADRHAPHSKPEFLERMAKRFPEVTLYTLRRDVFPATRMRDRLAREAAFEVVRVREHEEFWHPAEAEIRRDLIPIYTFATLGYVGTEMHRPQSGFCTYFLELDSRLSQVEWSERARVNLIDPNQDSSIRPCLIAVLRGLHYLHAERGVIQRQTRPVLDPHQWIAPGTIGGAGELKVMSSRRRGGVVLSLPALLAHVSTVLRGGAQ